MSAFASWRRLSMLLLAVTVTACSSGPAASQASDQPSMSESQPDDRPIDATIKPVSRSDPPPDAQAALEACQITEAADFDRVVAMGFIPNAADLPRYINITGQEPEINASGGAWAIVLQGEVPQPMSHEIWVDPTCVIIGGEQGWFATGGGYKVQEDGKPGPFVEAIQTSPGPDLALPPLAQ